MSQVFTCTQTHIITQHFLPCFCLCFIWKSIIPACKHPKTITIVADNRRGLTTDLHLFVCLCTSLCASGLERFFARVFVSKCTNTHSHTRFRAMCEPAGNPRALQNGCSLPASQLKAYCWICVSPLP